MEKLGRYHIESTLGAGGMATVYVAKDEFLGRKVALKVPHLHLSKRPDIRQRFLAEARAVASLDHENIVSIFDIGEEAEQLFLAMEFVEGQDFSEFLQKHAPLPDLVVAEILRQLLSGLVEAHSAGIIHRDIKPQNLLLNRRGYLKIADFGLSRLAQQLSLTQTGGFLGTPRYGSPEWAAGNTVTEKSDIFAVGLILYECLMAKTIFEVEDPQVFIRCLLEKNIPSLDVTRPATWPCLTALYTGLLQKKPESRLNAKVALQQVMEGLNRFGGASGPKLLEEFLQNPITVTKMTQEKIQVFWEEEGQREDRNGNPAKARKYRIYSEMSFSKYSSDPLPQESKKSNWLWMLVPLIILTTTLGFFGRKNKSSALDPLIKSKSVLFSDSLNMPTKLVVESLAVKTSVMTKTVPAIKAKGLRVKSKETAKYPKSFDKIIPTYAYIRVLTRPPNARVFLDGQEIGISPFIDVKQVTAGHHSFALSHFGCAPHEESVHFKGGDTLVLKRELIRLP